MHFTAFKNIKNHLTVKNTIKNSLTQPFNFPVILLTVFKKFNAFFTIQKHQMSPNLSLIFSINPICILQHS